MASKEEYAKRKAAGLCVQCEGPLPAVRKPKQSRCETCIAKNKVTRRMNRAKRKEAGRCTECPGTAKPGCAMCQKCIDQRTDYSDQRYRDNKAAGTCRTCGKPSGGKARCPEHEELYRKWRRRPKPE